MKTTYMIYIRLDELFGIFHKLEQLEATDKKETIESFIARLGFEFNFKIKKIGVHIYTFADATLPFYTIIGESGKMSHFIEIEVNEELISKLTELEAFDIIRKYEKMLEPLGIKPQNRLRKSLFELYRK